MEAFATLEDYEARYGDVDDAEGIEALLGDASCYIRAALDEVCHPERYLLPTEEYSERLKRACVQMVHQAAGTESPAPYGATQFSQGAGSYTEQYTFGNPYGELFMTKSIRILLGLNGAKACFKPVMS